MHDVPFERNDAPTDVVPSVATVPIDMPAGTTIGESHPFRFTGTTSGFFSIWIFILFLTIITLCI